MTDAKHEAPAETITSAELIANTDYARGAVRVPGETEDRRIYGQPEALAEGAGEDWRAEYDRVERIGIEAQRQDELARGTNDPISKSEHEAQASGHWARYERECAKMNAKALRARSSAPEAREEAQPVDIGAMSRLTRLIEDRGNLRRAYHPSTFSDPVRAFWSDVAPPTQPLAEGADAEKLRVALEALLRWDIYNGGVTEGFVIEADFKGEWVRYDDIDQALAALQQEGR